MSYLNSSIKISEDKLTIEDDIVRESRQTRKRIKKSRDFPL